MATAIKIPLFQCRGCSTLYEDANEAMLCCYDGPIDGYICSECSALYEGHDIEAAQACCPEDDDCDLD